MEVNKICCIAVLHDLNLASRYASHTVVIDSGQLVRHGNTKACLSKELIQQVWQYQPSEFINNAGIPIYI